MSRRDVAPTDAERRGFVRRHPALSSVVGLFLLLLVVVLAFALWLNSSLGNIDRLQVTLDEQDRPPASQGEDLNILLLGTDVGSERNTDGRGILEDAASGDWPTGKYRSDTTMLVHVPADRDGAVVMSIPRDSYVPIHDDRGDLTGPDKINAALSLHGPSGAVSTVENLTGLRVDHVTMLDWDGFRDITDALGGVTVPTPEGRSTLGGEEALGYVRDRTNVPGGDFGRIQRQQNFLRAIVAQTLSRGTLSNPLKLRSTVDAVSESVAVDEEWSNGEIRSLAFSMRSIRPADITFMTVPVIGTDTDPVAGSIVRLDDAEGRRLYEAVAAGNLSAFLADNPDVLLPPSDEVD